MIRRVSTISAFTLCVALLGCDAGTDVQPDGSVPDGSTSPPDAGPDGGPVPQSAKMSLPTRGIPDPVLLEVETPEPSSSNLGFGPKGLASGLPGPTGDLGRFGDRVEQCVQQGGSLADCAGTAGLCAARDAALGQVGGVVFDKLGLAEVAKNYYCDGECYHCCWVPGGGIGGGGGTCHSSFDTSEGPVVNCNPGVYGPGTVGVGPALVIGDSLGLGICVGGVQQVCNHIAQCNGAGSSAGPGGTGPGATSAAKSLVPKGDPASTGEPPNENMSSLQALYLHIQSLESAMRRSFFANQRATPARTRRKAYVDFITARGTVNWTRILREIEPYNREYDVFAVTDSSGVVLPAASYHRGIVYHANLAFVGAVPHLVDRIGYVESRYWTDEEKDDYLDGIDPEAELRKTMSPMAFEALKSVPIQDWRLLAQVAPNEPEIPYRTYDGFRLGRAPIVTAAQDCVGEAEVTLAVALEDPEESNQEDSAYPVIIDWGDGTVSRHTFDSSLATNAYSHSYADAGTFVAYVTAANSTGLRGVAGVVVEAEGGSPDSSRPSIATVALDQVRVYSPAVSLGGDLSFEVRAAQTNGQSEGIGWSDLLTLANAGPNSFGDIVGYNESLMPFDTVVLRPFHMGGSSLDSVYLQVPSMTLGFYDPRAGAIVSQTIPLTEEMLRVYYDGATAPVPVGELERDVNGELIVPVLRTNDNLAADFCGGDACERVDRIEIDLTPEIMGTRPAVPPGVFEDLRPGDAARWVEDVPNVFLASPEPSANELSGACATTLSPNPVVADQPVSSLVQTLTIVPNAPVVSAGSPVQLEATATLLDGSTLDVTEHATWTVDDETVLTVSNGADKGLLSPSTIPGTTAVVAALGGATAQAMAIHDAPDRGYRSYRFHFDAVHGGAGKASISGVELFVDGRLLESLMESEDSGTIGPFPAFVSSSEGSDPTYAFDVPPGTAWSSAEGTFDLDDPYSVGDSPVYLQVDFETPLPVDGIRIHRTAGILFVSYGPWFPKQVRVQGSNDGTTFTDIEGASTTFDNWQGEPAIVRWDLP